MEKFITKHEKNIEGCLSCVDRIVFKGYLPISWADAFGKFLSRNNVLIKNFGVFAKQISEKIKVAAMELAEQQGRPYIYLNGGSVRKEAFVKEIAQKDGIERGLVCVLSAVEGCQSFRIAFGKGRPVLKNCKRKCLCIYFYYIDPVFGLLHIRLQSWLPLNIQICMNGHSWLAMQMKKRKMSFSQDQNCFTSIDEIEKAQELADRFVRLKWTEILSELAERTNPLLQTMFKHMNYYWVCDQMEYATDIMFKNSYKTLYEKLLNHSIIRMSSKDILTFLGKPFDGRFKGEQINHGKKIRFPGARVKHWVKRNWIKMYSKNSIVLRVETVINHPYDFRIWRSGRKDGKIVKAWYPMSKCVANLYRYAEVCLSANKRYLEALSTVDDPAPSKKELKELCSRVTRQKKKYSGFNPVQHETATLFKAVLSGDYIVQGFRNVDIRMALYGKQALGDERKKLASRICRLLKKMKVRGLIAKIPHSRRWRVTRKGWRILGPLVEAYA